MPSPVPTFDHQAALEAAERCRALARRLRDALDQRHQLAATARQQWQGPSRQEFDQRFAALQAEGEAAATRLTALATGLVTASEHAAVVEHAAAEATQP